MSLVLDSIPVPWQHQNVVYGVENVPPPQAGPEDTPRRPPGRSGVK